VFVLRSTTEICSPTAINEFRVVVPLPRTFVVQFAVAAPVISSTDEVTTSISTVPAAPVPKIATVSFGYVRVCPVNNDCQDVPL
jgi:hypothetical protein